MDLVGDYVEKLAGVVTDGPVTFPSGEDAIAFLNTTERAYREASLPVATLLANGVLYDDGAHSDLWVSSLQRLLDANQDVNSYQPGLRDFRFWPALLCLRAMGLAALRRGGHKLLFRLFTEPEWTTINDRSHIAADVLNLQAVVQHDLFLNLSRFGGTQWHWDRWPWGRLFTDSAAMDTQLSELRDAAKRFRPRP